MASTKAHQVEAYLSRPPQHRIILVFGPDRGLVAERATKVASTFGAELEDPFATVKLDADDAASEPGRIYEEASTVSMFGGKRLVWVRGSTLKNLVRAVQPVLDDPPGESLVLIEADDLKPGTGLRKAIEVSTSGMALPCYADEGAALDTMIDEEMREAGLALDREARALLKSNLGGDRLASRAEVRKLALYALNDGTVTEAHVEEIVGDASTGATDRWLDAVANGRGEAIEAQMSSLLEGGTSPVALAGSLQRHFQMLHRARSMMDANNRDAGTVVGGMRPPINFKRKQDVVSALQRWRNPRLLAALSRIERTAYLVRANGDLAREHLGMAVMALVAMGGR